jgi:nicotinamide riboside kinase
MKTTPQIEEEIKARQAELDSLISEHTAMVQDFNQKVAKNQQRGSFLEGCIAALKDLIADKEPDAAG